MLSPTLPSAASLALYATGWLCGWLLLWPFRRAPQVVARAAGASGLAVVVPARDEEATLPALLASLPAGTTAIVVDDHSTDATAAVAAAAGAHVVPAPPLPEGWTGKSWACATGAQAAIGGGATALAFVDADVVLAPGALADLEAERRALDPGGAALVSVQPWHDARRPYEKLSLLFNVTALMGSAAFTVLGRRVEPRLAFGPVMLVGAAAYDAAGGHGAVRTAVAEDIALARLLRPVRLEQGRALATFRMYPGGLRSLVQGWTKNIATGAGSLRWWVLLGVVGWVWSLAGAPFTSLWCYLASALQVWVLGRRAGRFGPLAALAYPALLAFFLVVFLRSVTVTVLRRPVTWKGRSVSPR